MDVDSGTDGGSVCNDADLEGAACGGTLSVIVGYTPDDFVDITPDDGIDNPVNIGHQPIYATYECAPAAEANAGECASVGPPSVCAFTANDYCTYDRGNGNNQGYSGTTGTAGTIFDNNYLTAFPNGLTIGLFGASTNDAFWTADNTCFLFVCFSVGRNEPEDLSQQFTGGSKRPPGCGHYQCHQHGRRQFVSSDCNSRAEYWVQRGRSKWHETQLRKPDPVQPR